MKKIVKFSGGILLTVIYCFALYSVTQPLPETFTYHSNHSGQQQKISKVTKSLFNLTTGTENLGYAYNPSPIQFLKIPFFNAGWITTCRELLIASKFSQYTKHQTNTLVDYRKNDSIFPFHYFW